MTNWRKRKKHFAQYMTNEPFEVEKNKEYDADGIYLELLCLIETYWPVSRCDIKFSDQHHKYPEPPTINPHIKPAIKEILSLAGCFKCRRLENEVENLKKKLFIYESKPVVCNLSDTAPPQPGEKGYVNMAEIDRMGVLPYDNTEKPEPYDGNTCETMTNFDETPNPTEKLKEYVIKNGWYEDNETPVDTIIRTVGNFIANNRDSKEYTEHLKSELSKARDNYKQARRELDTLHQRIKAVLVISRKTLYKAG